MTTRSTAELQILPYTARVLSGGVTKPNSGNATTQIDIAASKTCDDNGVVHVGTGMTKTINVAWAAGTGNGGNFNGTTVPANGLLAFWKIVKTADQTIDYGYDTLANGKTNAITPAGYTKVCLMWHVPTGAAGVILAYTQVDNECILAAPLTQAVTVGAARSLITVRAPVNSKVKMRNSYSATGNVGTNIGPTYEADTAVAAANGYSVLSPGSSLTGNMEQLIIVDASQQIYARATVAGVNITFNTLGWTYSRGKED